MSKKTKAVAVAVAHDIRKGSCVVCHRMGGELKLACPGYRTAGDHVLRTPPAVIIAKQKGRKAK